MMISLEFEASHITDLAVETAEKLHMDNNTCQESPEQWATFFMQYFIYQHNKISLGLLDAFLPEGTKEAWQVC